MLIELFSHLKKSTKTEYFRPNFYIHLYTHMKSVVETFRHFHPEAMCAMESATQWQHALEILRLAIEEAQRAA